MDQRSLVVMGYEVAGVVGKLAKVLIANSTGSASRGDDPIRRARGKSRGWSKPDF